MHDLLSFLPSNNQRIISTLIWIMVLTFLCILSVLMAFISNRQENKNYQPNKLYFLFLVILQILTKPLLALVMLYCLYVAINIGLHYLPKFQHHVIATHLTSILNIGEFLIFFWVVFNIIKIGKLWILEWARRTNNKTISIILPAISSSLYIVFFLIMINILLPILNLSPDFEAIANKTIKAFLISMFGWVFFQIINIIEKFIYNQYVLNNDNVIMARKIQTQLLILKRIVVSLLIIIVLASILMLFESVRNLGTGLLTTAGIIGTIGAFASQQSLSRIFSGLVMAFTQPIKLGDTIIVENEFGQVEKITLSYVVVKLWDLRRLILPTDYFMNKGLQNLTRESSDLLGTVFLYVDYTLPVDVVRTKFFELLNASVMWDKNVAAFHVTDIKENCMEIRALMSAENSGKLWELRCQIREKLINFIVEKFPECLSKSRHSAAINQYKI